jgi:hypothetical protein
VSSVHHNFVLIKLIHRVDTGKHSSVLPRPFLEDSSTDLGEGLSESILELHAGDLTVLDFSGRESNIHWGLTVDHLHDSSIACHIY